MKAWLMEHRFALFEMFARLGRQPLSVMLNVLVVSVALALPLLGFTLLRSLLPISAQLASDPEISVFVSLDAKRSEALALGQALQNLNGVLSADFIAREDALTHLKTRPGMSDVIAALNQNPLPDAWVLRLRVQPGDVESVGVMQKKLVEEISALPKVDRVQVDSAWVQRMAALVRFVRLALAIVAAALAAAVVMVIFNTIRLQVATQREEIEVAKLIGATNRFVRRPFYYIGALQGLLGGLLAWGAVWLALIPLNSAILDFANLYSSRFQFMPLPWGDMASFLALSIFLGWLGAILSVSRHLSSV